MCTGGRRLGVQEGGRVYGREGQGVQEGGGGCTGGGRVYRREVRVYTEAMLPTY